MVKSPASIKDLYLDFKSTGKLSSLTQVPNVDRKISTQKINMKEFI